MIVLIALRGKRGKTEWFGGQDIKDEMTMNVLCYSLQLLDAGFFFLLFLFLVSEKSSEQKKKLTPTKKEQTNTKRKRRTGEIGTPVSLASLNHSHPFWR